jgi:hypothetical protein
MSVLQKKKKNECNDAYSETEQKINQFLLVLFKEISSFNNNYH